MTQLKTGLARKKVVELGSLIGYSAILKTRSPWRMQSRPAQWLSLAPREGTLGATCTMLLCWLAWATRVRVWTEEIVGPIVPPFGFSSDDGRSTWLLEGKLVVLGAFPCSINNIHTWCVASALECGLLGVKRAQYLECAGPVS